MNMIPGLRREAILTVSPEVMGLVLARFGGIADERFCEGSADVNTGRDGATRTLRVLFAGGQLTLDSFRQVPGTPEDIFVTRLELQLTVGIGNDVMHVERIARRATEATGSWVTSGNSFGLRLGLGNGILPRGGIAWAHLPKELRQQLQEVAKQCRRLQWFPDLPQQPPVSILAELARMRTAAIPVPVDV